MYQFELISNNQIVGRVRINRLDCLTIQLRYNVGFVEAAESAAIKLFKQYNTGFMGSLYAVLQW